MSETTPGSALSRGLAARTDLDPYKHSKRLLFAAQVILGIEDIHAVAKDALTDGSGDRSCDFLYVDRDSATILLAQSYVATARQEVAAKKVQSLYEAVDWVLSQQLRGLPTVLESAIEQARAALRDGEIRHFKIWFVHNLKDQPQIHEALNGAGDAARNALDARFKDVADNVAVEVLEVSDECLSEWYAGYASVIDVKEKLVLPWRGGQRIVGRGWEAAQTAVPLKWLADQFWAFRQRLFSANVRDYLGRANAPNNINHGIRTTLEEEPENFFVYNNGVTALTEEFEIVRGSDGEELLILKGLSIVNGAQTTGVLQGSDGLALDDAQVSIRFIMCENRQIIDKIIRFNNRQNSVSIGDYRSNDPVQGRLAEEFQTLGIMAYRKIRRGGSRDAIRRTDPAAILATYAARALVAFHGDPVVAHFNPAWIWEDKSMYRRYFCEDLSARHLIVCWGLAKSLERLKQGLRAAAKLSDGRRKQLDFLDRQGSIWLATSAIAACSDGLTPGLTSGKFDLELADPVNSELAIGLWDPLVQKVIPYAPAYLEALLGEGGRWKDPDLNEAIHAFRVAVAPMLESEDDLRDSFAQAVRVRTRR